METLQPVSSQIEIDNARFDARHILFFDSFGIYPGESFYELHFGFSGKIAVVPRGLIVVVSRQVIAEVKENFFKYLGNMGTTTPPVRALPGCQLDRSAEVVFADMVGLARHGAAEAEILLHAFSWKVAIERVRTHKETTPLTAICVAILRSDVEVQKRWILGLYEDEDEIGKSEAS